MDALGGGAAPPCVRCSPVVTGLEQIDQHAVWALRNGKDEGSMFKDDDQACMLRPTKPYALRPQSGWQVAGVSR